MLYESAAKSSIVTAAASEVCPSVPPVVGESLGNGKVGVPMVTGGEPSPVVGEPPGGGKEGASMLTANEPGRKAGEPHVT